MDQKEPHEASMSGDYQPQGDSIPACGHKWANGGKSGCSQEQGPKLRPCAQSISMASSGEVPG